MLAALVTDWTRHAADAAGRGTASLAAEQAAEQQEHERRAERDQDHFRCVEHGGVCLLVCLEWRAVGLAVNLMIMNELVC